MERNIITGILALTLFSNVVLSQDEAVVVDADSAIIGADYSNSTDGNMSYVTPSTDFIDGSFPGSEDKLITFSLHFPDTGTYDLYAKIRVGVGNYNDDSFFAGKGFGPKSATTPEDWTIINGIVEVGFSSPADFVTTGGNAGILTWKWINISEYVGGETPLTYLVESTDSSYTFVYGARENGLDLDKIAFGKSGLFYTVQNLENGEAGTDSLPGGNEYPDSAALLVKTYVNPIMPGDHPDATLLKKDNDFYHCISSFHFTPYLPIQHSTDLVHWKEIARVVQPDWAGLINDEPQKGIWQGAITFFYGSYWIYFSNTAGGGQYFCKAEKPEGPWSNPIKVKTTSTTGIIGYDNSVFVDDDGTPYMTIKPGKTVNRIQQIGADGHLTGAVINLDWINADGRYSWAEGPVMCKKDGWYYYFMAGNVAGGQYVARSKTLTSDSTQWEEMGSVFPSASDPDASLQTPNHMSQPYQLDDGTWWTVAHSYQRVGGDDWNGQGRQGVLHQITWDENGKPTATAPTSKPLIKPNLSNTGAIPWKLPRTDYFESYELGLWWHLLNTSAAGKYSLTENTGWLTINPGTGGGHILQKEGGHYYTAVTRVDIDAQEAGHEAGIYITNGNESVNVKLYSGFDNGKKIMFSFGAIVHDVENTVGNVVYLKIDRREHALTGYYSYNGLVWYQVGNAINVTDLDKVQPSYNWWVGTSLGLFAEGTQAKFDLFKYKDGFSHLPVAGYNNYFGVETLETSLGKSVTNTEDNGGWSMLGGVELGNGDKIPIKMELVASATTDGKVEVWLDNLEKDGTLVASVDIASTGGVDSFEEFTAAVSGVSGQHDVFIRFSGTAGNVAVNSLRFVPDDIYYSVDKFNMENWVQVYPNPFINSFTIEIKQNQANYFIYNLLGELVDQGIIVHRKQTLGKNLPPDFYILKVQSAELLKTIKIQKR